MKIEIRETKENGLIQITTLDERWYQRQSDLKLFKSSTWISDYYPKGVQFYKWLASKGWDEAEAIKTAAGEKGTRVHRAIDILIARLQKGDNSPLSMTDSMPDNDGVLKEFTPEEWEAVMSFVEWWNEAKPEVIKSEQAVYNEQYGYAGTLDLLCKIDGKVWLIDFKTSSSIWPSHELQISSYLHADQVEADHIAILQVGYKLNKKKKWKLTELEDRFDLFLHALAICEHENEGVMPKQKDFPLTLSLIGEK